MPIAAQPVGGNSGGVLSDRASYHALFRAGPQYETELLLILRGPPGWPTGAQRASGSSVGPDVVSLRLGQVDFEFSYRHEGRILRFRGTDYPLDRANVVIIDRVDGVGGAPVISRRLTLSLPNVVPGNTGFARAISSLPELRELVR